MLDVNKYLFTLSDEQKANLIAEDVEMSQQEKEDTMVLFESSVNEQVNKIFDAITEDFDSRLESEKEAINENLNEQIKDYLEYVIEDWKEENKPALQANIVGQLNERFMTSLKDLFVECYKEVPDERVDALLEMNEKLDKATSQVDALFEENRKLKKDNLISEKALVANRLVEEMADTEKEKATELFKTIVAEDVEEFETKAKVILEAKFNVEDGEQVDEGKKDVTPKDTNKGKTALSSFQNSLVESVLQENFL